MSKKSRWRRPAPASPFNAHSEPEALAPANQPEASPSSECVAGPIHEFGPISPAQLAANRANARFSTGPRTEAGKANSSKNAVKSALTGRTVLLPTDDVEEYARWVAELQQQYKPVGLAECQLVQTIVDCHWRLNRIQELEYALYTHGHRQFESALADEPEETRHSMIVLQTHLTYQKELRNLHTQEARIDRKRSKTLAELKALQAERLEPSRDDDEADAESDFAPFASEEELFAALDAGYVPPHLAPYMNGNKPLSENGFVFSNDTSAPPNAPSSGD